MTAWVIYTSGFEADPHDSFVAQIIRTRADGRTQILFHDGISYWVHPEEIEAIT